MWRVTKQKKNKVLNPDLLFFGAQDEFSILYTFSRGKKDYKRQKNDNLAVIPF
jgi:hypothetical protein